MISKGKKEIAMSKLKIFIIALIILSVVVVFAAVSNTNKNKSPRTKTKVSRTVGKNKKNQQRIDDLTKNEMKVLDRRIQANPNDAHAYSRRAALKQRMHDMKGATEDANKALQLDPNDKYANFVKKTLQPRTR